MKDLKIYTFSCDYENTLDDCSVVAKTKDEAIKYLSDIIEFSLDDWTIEEHDISEGMIL